jgi:hypothetical protein
MALEALTTPTTTIAAAAAEPESAKVALAAEE